MQRIRLSFSDALLMRAVQLMAEEMGYRTCYDENADFAITDVDGFKPDGCKTLLIGREERKDRLYLRRPFTREELSLALSALTSSESFTKKSVGGLRIDKKRGRVTLGGEQIELTEKELGVLMLLDEKRGSAVSDEEILDRVWHSKTQNGSNIVAVYIKYLRSKLDDRAGIRLIFRVRGEGYMLKVKNED